jgi:hypothetical protein
MRHLLSSLLLISVPLMANDLPLQPTQDNPIQPETKTLIGTLIKKPWRKAYDSYCAGGSDYFVLQQENSAPITLKYTAPKGGKSLNELIDQHLLISGYYQTQFVSPTERSADGFISQTMSTTVWCTHFVVQHIQLNPSKD